MRIVIHFGKTVRDARFLKSFIETAKGTKGKLSPIGSVHGICISNLSWNDSFEISSKLLMIIRNEGLNCLEGVTLRIEGDVKETDLDTLFDHWKNG